MYSYFMKVIVDCILYICAASLLTPGRRPDYILAIALLLITVEMSLCLVVRSYQRQVSVDTLTDKVTVGGKKGHPIEDTSECAEYILSKTHTGHNMLVTLVVN